MQIGWSGCADRGASAGLIEVEALDLTMLDRVYKEYPAGEATPALASLAEKIRTADALMFVTGEHIGVFSLA